MKNRKFDMESISELIDEIATMNNTSTNHVIRLIKKKMIDLSFFVNEECAAHIVKADFKWGRIK